MDGVNDVLLAVEAEAYVDSIEVFDLKEYGSPRWAEQHCRLEKLNIQAVVSAMTHRDEFVKEFFIDHDKIKSIIQDLITTELWKENVFSYILESDFNPKTTFPLYMVLYHEATIVNLLETIMYHQDCCEVADDTINDLVDYCYRKLCFLVSRSISEENVQKCIKGGGSNLPEASLISSLEELEDQENILNFEICVKSISLFRYVTDHFQVLPLGVMNRVLNTHDLPNLMVQLVESPPWTMTINGKHYKYVSSKWQELCPEEQLVLSKTEGQVWIIIYQLLMDRACQERYDLNSYRKNTIMKLRRYLTPVLLDQIPVLGEFQRYLEHLSLMQPPSAKNNLILEQVPVIRENIIKRCEGKWKQIAKQQMNLFFDPPDEDICQQARKWASTYSFDVLESVAGESPRCAACGHEAVKRCSRCKNEWYCRRKSYCVKHCAHLASDIDSGNLDANIDYGIKTTVAA